MGYQTASQQRATVKTAGSSEASVLKSPDGSGYTVASQAITSSTVIKELVITPGSTASVATALSGSGGISITNVYAANSSYSSLTPITNAVNTAGGYVTILGNGFTSQSLLYIQGNLITSTSYVSSGQINAQLPAYSTSTATTLQLYVVNTATNSAGILVTGFRYSVVPYWTGPTTQLVGAPNISVNLSALSDSTMTYAVYSGTIPSGLALNSSTGVLSGTYSTGTSTSFVIQAIDQEQQANTQTFTITIVSSTDPYFNQTVLLLNGENSASVTNNNTLLDSSSNNYTVTRNGSTTQGSFGPFSQTGWSVYFGSTTEDDIIFPSASQYAIGTGNFTIECWWNPTASPSQSRIFIQGVSGTTNVSLEYNSGVFYSTINTTQALTYTPSITLNTWYHLALVRNGTSLVFYINGVSVATATNSASIGQNQVIIGGLNWATGYDVNGYISNLRYNNTAVYTSAFTPSTSPLTAITGTILLTCQSNRFIDNSSYGVIASVTNSPLAVAFSPFAPASVYTATNVGGSLYMNNGSGDSISFASISAFTFSGVFTLEAWVYWTSAPTSGNNMWGCLTSGGLAMYYDGNRFAPNVFGSGNIINTTYNGGNFLPTVGQWYHIAWTRNSSNLFTVWINGTNGGSATNSSSFTQAGWQLTTGSPFPAGYVSSLRYVSGSCLYTSAFTPPTTPLANVAGTVFLVNATNGAIIDQTAKNNLIAYGSAVAETSVVKYGSSALAFTNPTNGSYVYPITGNSLFNFGTGDFTIEAWLYPTSFSTTNGPMFIDFRPNATNSTSYFAIGISTGGVLNYSSNNNTYITAGTALSVNTWTHVAVARSSSVVKMFLNGVQTGSSYTDTNSYLAGTNRPIIGANGFEQPASGVDSFIGYMDDVRITRGVARYTANFTPPAAQLLTR